MSVADPSVANRASIDAKGNPLDIVPITPEEVDAAIEAAGAKSLEQAPPRLADKRAVSEAIEGLFTGLELSPEFKTKATALLEGFLAESAAAEKAALIAHYAKLNESYQEEVYEELSGQVNEYATYVASQWLNENKLAAESSLRLEAADRVINGLKNVIVEAGLITLIPEDENRLATMEKKISSLTEQLNDAVRVNLENEKTKNTARRTEIIESLASTLTAVDKGRLETIAESLDSTDIEAFTTRITAIAESYIPANKSSGKVADSLLTEQVVTPEKVAAPSMTNYMTAIRRLAN